jgi:pilus assembly protein TadC
MASLNLYESLVTPNDDLKRKLKIAHDSTDPKKYMKMNFNASIFFSLGICIPIFFLTSNPQHLSPLPFLAFPVIFITIYTVLYARVDVAIKKREKEINRNIVYATRYLILKLDSGQPLLNSMIRASRKKDVGGRFFQEIVYDISLGKPIERALEEAQNYSASHLFQLVLRQILNALRTGIDVSGSLRKLLVEITRQQEIEIKGYSKKLNSVILFYLIGACVFPSLGIAMFLIMGSMMNLNFDWFLYGVILAALLFIQSFFIIIVRGIKPTVDI